MRKVGTDLYGFTVGRVEPVQQDPLAGHRHLRIQGGDRAVAGVVYFDRHIVDGDLPFNDAEVTTLRETAAGDGQVLVGDNRPVRQAEVGTK